MKLLIAEDDPVHCRLVEKLLTGWGYQVTTSADGQEALELLERNGNFQLVIADWMMPRMDGLALCRAVRERQTEPYVYLILLTARDKRDDIVAGLEAGADDYLTKPVHHSELSARIRAAKRIIDLQNELLAAREELRFQAMHDSLTGLWNRRAIFDALQREVDRARREHVPLSLIMIDLDHFKQINDTHGHPAGDEVLRASARRIQQGLRSYDAVGRYGGEEFLVLAPGLDRERALDLAERIRGLFDGHPVRAGEAELAVTLSLGVVVTPPTSDAGVDSMLSAADAALYQAKRGGRNMTSLGTVQGGSP